MPVAVQKLEPRLSLSLSLSQRRVAWAVAGLLAAASTTPLFAQTSTGSIFGDADPGTVVSIKSAATGLTRNITVGRDGKFTFTVLPPGIYTVTEGKNTKDIQVVPGEGSQVVMAEAVEEVVVSATTTKHIDVSTPEVYTTYSAQLMEELPVPKDIASFAVLAPGAVRGTGVPGTAYSQLPSIAGSGIAENTYYINGFNTTNLFSNTSFATLPFPAIASEQVITSGYGPEYGMATGGVISVQTKKGTNTWEVGGQATWDPNSMRSNNPTTYLHSDGTTPYQDYSQNSDELGRYDLWVGGPLIKDKLFIYVAAEFQKESTLNYPNTYGGGQVIAQDNSQPFGLVNLDYIINDRNTVDFTFISNQNAVTSRSFSGVPPTTSSGFYTMGAYTGADVVHTGGTLAILKYTGNITDNLTVSAQYGQLHNKDDDYEVLTNGTISGYPFGQLGDTNIGGCPTVVYSGSWQQAHTVNGVPPAVPTCEINNGAGLGVNDGEDTRRAGKIELSYKLGLPLPVFATQTFEAGYDFDRWSSKAGSTQPGGAEYIYDNGMCGTSSSQCNLYSAAAPYTGDYYEQVLFQTNAQGSVNTNSYYFKDNIQATKTIMLTAGVRNDSFDNINGAGETYVSQKNIWEPRFGATWDIEGDAKSKLYANYGIYTNPITAGVAVRGASASDYCLQYYKYTAINSVTGAPTQGAALANNSYCFNGENGMTPPAGTFASTTLSPTKTEEFVVGFQQALPWNGWTAGIEGTYTNLLNTIDDYCDFRGFYAWGADHNVSTAGLDNYLETYGSSPCFLINPGKSASLSYDITGSGKLTSMNLTSAELGLPDAIRKYVGVNLTLDKSFDGKWGFSFIYTWSHQYGNTEGTSDSDNSQADIGTTENFDYPQIMAYSYGDLPNDHRHTIKATGEYQAFKDLLISGNFLFQSGKPVNCIGYNAALDGGDNVDAPGGAPGGLGYGGGGYGDVYHFCNGVPVPRGTAGRLPSLFQLDMGLVYTPSSQPGLALGIQVYNLFNKLTPLTINETATENASTTPSPSYQTVLSYQQPRYVELSVKYQFDFAKH